MFWDNDTRDETLNHLDKAHWFVHGALDKRLHSAFRHHEQHPISMASF